MPEGVLQIQLGNTSYISRLHYLENAGNFHLVNIFIPQSPKYDYARLTFILLIIYIITVLIIYYRSATYKFPGLIILSLTVNIELRANGTAGFEDHSLNTITFQCNITHYVVWSEYSTAKSHSMWALFNPLVVICF